MPTALFPIERTVPFFKVAENIDYAILFSILVVGILKFILTVKYYIHDLS